MRVNPFHVNFDGIMYSNYSVRYIGVSERRNKLRDSVQRHAVPPKFFS